MKKIFFTVLGLATALTVNAQQQVKTPAPSPAATAKQTVGLTTFEVNYSRPSLNGRDMHKDIVPLDQPWRFGANMNTTISFDTPVTIGGKQVKPGTYAMFAIPSAKEWKIQFYNETKNWGYPAKFKKSNVVAEVAVPVMKTDNKVETFTISFEDLLANDFNLVVSWENTRLPIDISLPTEELAVASIKEVMAASPNEIDYFRAAGYYLNVGINLEDALVYIDKSIELKDNVPTYYVHTKALILAKLGKNEEAIKVAEESKQLAKKQKYDEYVRKNDALIKSLK